ncbi:MAG: nucleotidyltransferase family protein [Gemmatimonadota bacterium]|nr:nucleotidyltransferase family protein [Gemmatimonadota bacterium]
MTTWSPELLLLARLSRLAPTADDESRARALIDGPLDWPRLLRLAEHHGVSPLADGALQQMDSARVPAFVRERMHGLHLSSVRGDLARYHAWLAVCWVFAAHDLRAVTLKGFPVALQTYGALGLRPVGDLDFLVRARDVPRALALLGEAGYPAWPVWQAAIRHVGFAHIARRECEIGCQSSRGIVVDLHWEAAPRGYALPTDEVLDGAVRLRVDGQEVLVPSPDAAMALLLLHGEKSAWGRLRWLVDVAEGMERMTDAEYASVGRRLDAMRMRPVLANALALLDGLWGRLPAVCAGGEHRGAEQRGQVRYSRSALERDRDWSHLHDAWRPVRLVRDRVGRWPSLGAAIASAASPNFYDWGYVSLPRGLRLGYYAVRPYRLVKNALASRRGRAPVSRAVPLAPAADVARVRESRRRVLGAPLPFTFVTAIYDSGPNSLLGGRGWGLDHYIPSLKNIANLGAPIVVFCPPADAPRIEAAIAPWFVDCRVVPFELSAFEHFDTFLAWKRTYRRTLPINDRNEVLCFLKSYWVQQAITDDPFGHERFFWIDSGLTHHGIFPARVGGVELRTSPPDSHYFPRNPANLFTPALGRALAHAVPRGEVLFCALPLRLDASRRERYEEVAAATFGRARDGVRMVDHLVGGLFGGHADDLRAFHRLYTELLRTFIDTRTYTLEEQVFSALYALFPERFSVRRFGTWWFYSRGERTSYLEAEGDSFYKIFVELASGQSRTGAGSAPATAASG